VFRRLALLNSTESCGFFSENGLISEKLIFPRCLSFSCDTVQTIKILKHEKQIQIFRDLHGIPHIEAETEADLFFGQGYAQAMDRGLQIMLSRIQGQGRLCELMEASDESLQSDIFFRKMNWTDESAAPSVIFDKNTKSCIDAFCAGINAYFANNIPSPLKIKGIRMEPWRVEDVYLFIRMIGYVNEMYTQGETEQFLLRMLKSGVSEEKLNDMFPSQLNGMDISSILKISFPSPASNYSILQKFLLPRFSLSNSWILSGKKTESGKPFLISNPTVRMKNLPSCWQEIVLQTKKRKMIGASVPGIPGLFLGRNNDVAWGGNYGGVDGVDSWIEECRGGKYKRKRASKTEWVRFRERREMIKYPGKKNYFAVFYENDHGTLEGSPEKDGFYLTRRWTSDSRVGVATVVSLINMLNIKNVSTAVDNLSKIELSFHWVVGDNKGDIGYQLSGLIPKKRGGVSGFVPLQGWDVKNDWKGFYSANQLPRKKNPPEGFIVTSDRSAFAGGKLNPVSLPATDYSEKRIDAILRKKRKLSTQEITFLQFDLVSAQAELFMKIIRPLLRDSNEEAKLKDWDFRYTLDSEGAYLFEKFYQYLIDEIFRPYVQKKNVMSFLFQETGVFLDAYSFLDNFLLKENSPWFEGRTREEIYRKALDGALSHGSHRWRVEKKTVLHHQYWSSLIPRMFRFERGSVALPGGRATILQCHNYRLNENNACFGTVYRLNVDIAEEGIRTSLLGGPGEQRYSRRYISDLKNWLAGKFKHLK